MDLRNSSPFPATHFVHLDRDGAETMVVVVKGTWQIGAGGVLSLAEEQVPIHHTPVYSVEGERACLVYDTDLVPEKPGTDCVLIGNAWAPGGKASQVDVTFAVGNVRKRARVFGIRFWLKTLGLLSVSRPVPFEKIPLTWDNAFGGSDTSSSDAAEHECFQDNPVGKGLRSRNSKLPLDGLQLPNIEDIECLISQPHQRPRPMGFSMIPPHWQPRVSYAGTYDDNWRRFRCPLAPADLDPRFYSAAAPGLLAPGHLRGNEEVLVEGAVPPGRLHFQLPGITPRATIAGRSGQQEVSLLLDTVIVEPELARVTLVWRGRQEVHGAAGLTGQVRVIE